MNHNLQTFTSNYMDGIDIYYNDTVSLNETNYDKTIMTIIGAINAVETNHTYFEILC